MTYPIKPVVNPLALIDFATAVLGERKALELLLRAGKSQDPMLYAHRYGVLVRNYYKDLVAHLIREIPRQDYLAAKAKRAVEDKRADLEPQFKRAMRRRKT